MKIVDSNSRQWDGDSDPVRNTITLMDYGDISVGEPFAAVSIDGDPLFGVCVEGMPCVKEFVFLKWRRIE